MINVVEFINYSHYIIVEIYMISCSINQLRPITLKDYSKKNSIINILKT